MHNVNQYNYLGIVFSSRGRWKTASEMLSCSANKAVFSLKNMLNKTYNLPVSQSLKLFDSKILPILLYGAELWGAEPDSSLTRIYNNYHKYLLGLPVNCVSITAIGELGRPVFQYYCTLKLISGWLRIINHSSDRYSKLLYYQQYQLAESNVFSWGLRVKSILCSLGFSFVWINQGVGDSNNFIEIFKQRLTDVNIQDWLNVIRTTDSLRSYALFKIDHFTEPYVLYLNNFTLRKAFAQLRCGALDIFVNSGRKNRLPFNQRICKYCSVAQIDDEYHFILICPFLKDLRSKYIKPFYFVHPSVDKFIQLMQSPSKLLCKSISSFIMSAIEHRKQHSLF